MSTAKRIAVLHGVNLNMLGQRDPAQYGTLTLAELEQRIGAFAAELDFSPHFFQTNFEGAFVEHLHGLRGQTDAIIINPGAWTHYAWAIREALEIAAVPAVEVHISDIKSREPWRAMSVIEELCVASVVGQGVEGYRLALQRLRAVLDADGVTDGADAGKDNTDGAGTGNTDGAEAGSARE
jgi:3-dehydroquinate dehydratase-2